MAGELLDRGDVRTGCEQCPALSLHLTLERLALRLDVTGVIPAGLSGRLLRLPRVAAMPPPCAPAALEALRRAWAGGFAAVETAAPILHGGAWAGSSTPGVRAAARRPREVAPRIPVLEWSKPTVHRVHQRFLGLPPVREPRRRRPQAAAIDRAPTLVSSLAIR